MRDPVCGMTVGPEALTIAAYPAFGFCSEHCRRSFLGSPQTFVDADHERGKQPDPTGVTNGSTAISPTEQT